MTSQLTRSFDDDNIEQWRIAREVMEDPDSAGPRLMQALRDGDFPTVETIAAVILLLSAIGLAVFLNPGLFSTILSSGGEQVASTGLKTFTTTLSLT